MVRKRKRRNYRRTAKKVAKRARSAAGRMVTRRHIGSVLGGAAYGVAERYTAAPLANIVPNVPLGLKQGILAYALTKMPGMFKHVGYAGLAIEGYQASKMVPGLGGTSAPTSNGNAW